MAVVSVSGIVQIFLGLFRLGDLAKFVPMPVIAGLRNGSAIVIVISQMRPILGLDGDASIVIDNILWPTAIIGILPFVVMWLGPRLTTKVPSAVLAIIAGTIAYYALANIGMGPQLTTVVGEISSAIPTPQ